MPRSIVVAFSGSLFHRHVALKHAQAEFNSYGD